MSLPEWNSEGLLDPGVHTATMEEVYERMVIDTPHRSHREMLFHSLSAYLTLVRRFIPGGRVWIDGGFSMRTPEAPHGDDAEPHGIDLAILPDDMSVLDSLSPKEMTDFYGLITLRDVIVSDPGPLHLDRIQPIGGALDAFIADPDDPFVWMETWSMVKKHGEVVEGMRKGFAEVIL